ncbi:hypothetical protein K525DRAFT_261778 [Schizophyllum commune Loenen D]|nr:hypothetical protein K525DRAFT_261778 [Schizophyllum commune Loenen D]
MGTKAPSTFARNRAVANTFSAELWSTLPVDILREIILEIAINYPVAAGHLRRVCSEFNRWILPVILKHVVLETSSDAMRYARTIHGWEDEPAKVDDNPWGVPLIKSLAKPKRNRFPRSVMRAQSLALVTPTQLPSVENALSGVDTLADIHSLAISYGNLGAHRFWLLSKHVRPRRIMLLHHGDPVYIDMRDELFSQVTHLYANNPNYLTIWDGYRIRDYSRGRRIQSECLRYIAIHTKLETMTEAQRRDVADGLRWILELYPTIEHLVLTVLPDPQNRPQDTLRRVPPPVPLHETPNGELAKRRIAAALQPTEYWDAVFPELSADTRRTESRKDLHRDPRFTPLLFPFDARREWTVEMDIWRHAELWKRAGSGELAETEFQKLCDELAQAWNDYPSQTAPLINSPTPSATTTGGPWLTDATKDKKMLRGRNSTTATRALITWTPVEAPWALQH